jgi:hypothetical protein
LLGKKYYYLLLKQWEKHRVTLLYVVSFRQFFFIATFFYSNFGNTYTPPLPPLLARKILMPFLRL